MLGRFDTATMPRMSDLTWLACNKFVFRKFIFPSLGMKKSQIMNGLLENLATVSLNNNFDCLTPVTRMTSWYQLFFLTQAYTLFLAIMKVCEHYNSLLTSFDNSIFLDEYKNMMNVLASPFYMGKNYKWFCNRCDISLGSITIHFSHKLMTKAHI